MAKDNKTVFEIFMESVGIYLKHFTTLLKYMSFPVFGQVIGLILSLMLPIIFINNNFGGNYVDDSNRFLFTLLLSVPGIIIFTKAFWEYLIAYVSVGSMAENTIKSGRIYDINAHKKIATMSKRVGEFITLWIFFGIFSSIAILPPMWIIAGIFFVYIILIFQVFTFERNSTAIECFTKSFKLIKVNFISTVSLLLFVGLTTYFLMPKIAEFVLEFLQIYKISIMVLDPIIVKSLPIEQWNSALSALNVPYLITSLEISKIIISSVISWLVISFTLPLRTICWTLWYKQLSIKEIKSHSKKKKAK